MEIKVKVIWTTVYGEIKGKNFTFLVFFNWNSPCARLNSHYEAWNYKKNKHKNVKAYRKSL